jgi:hypothetical protein
MKDVEKINKKDWPYLGHGIKPLKKRKIPVEFEPEDDEDTFVEEKHKSKPLKDTEKMYKVTDDCIKTFDSKKKLISFSPVSEIHHFGIKRDYEIILEDGSEIWIDAGIIKMIVDHERSESDE